MEVEVGEVGGRRVCWSRACPDVDAVEAHRGGGVDVMHRRAVEAHALQAALVREARGELDQPRPQLDGVVHRVPPDERRHDGGEPARARAHVEEGEAGPQLERLERARVD